MIRFGGQDGPVLYLDHGGGYTTVYICQNLYQKCLIFLYINHILIND